MAKSREKDLRIEELGALTHLLRDRAGRRWLYNLLSFCHAYESSFRTNALAMAYAEGERNVGLKIIADITEASPELYFQMHKEMSDERLWRNDDTGTSGTDTEPDSSA